MTRMLPGRVITTIARRDGAQCAFAGARPRRCSRGCREPTAPSPSPSTAPPTGGRPSVPRASARSASSGTIGAGLDDYVRRPFIQLGARDDAAAGAHRRPVGVARFSGAGLHGVPEDAGRRRVPGDHRPARARDHGSHLRGRRRPFPEPSAGNLRRGPWRRATARGSAPRALPGFVRRARDPRRATSKRWRSYFYFGLPKYLSNCLCTSASMVGLSSDSMNPSSQSRRTVSLPTWSAPLRPGA